MLATSQKWLKLAVIASTAILSLAAQSHASSVPIYFSGTFDDGAGTVSGYFDVTSTTITSPQSISVFSVTITGEYSSYSFNSSGGADGSGITIDRHLGWAEVLLEQAGTPRSALALYAALNISGTHPGIDFKVTPPVPFLTSLPASNFSNNGPGGPTVFFSSGQFSAVPEPSSVMLASLGLLGTFAASRGRKVWRRINR